MWGEGGTVLLKSYPFHCGPGRVACMYSAPRRAHAAAYVWNGERESGGQWQWACALGCAEFLHPLATPLSRAHPPDCRAFMATSLWCCLCSLTGN